MTDFDYELLGEMLENAPLEGGQDFNKINFGRVYGDNYQAVHWNNGYQKRPYKLGKEKLLQGESVEFQLHQEIEAKDGSIYIMTWFLSIKNSGKNKALWAEYIQPAIVNVLGGKPLKDKVEETKRVVKAVSKFFSLIDGNGTYMEIEAFKTGSFREDKKGKLDDNGEVVKYPVTAPVVLAVFKNKAESDKARAEKYKKSDTASANGKIPAETLGEVRGFLVAMAGKSDDEIKQMLAEGYPDYDASELLEAAKVAPY